MMMGFSMNNDDDQYAVLRELLESGALSRKDFSEETLKLVYGGQTNAPSTQTVDKSPAPPSTPTPPKVEQPKVTYSQIEVKKTPSQAESRPVDAPPRRTNEKSQQPEDNQTSKKFRGLSYHELSNYFHRQQLQDVILLKDLVEIGLVPESELESIKSAIIRDRRPYSQPFKREPEERRQGVDISAALTGIAIIQWFSVILGILGAIAGLVIAANKVDDPICFNFTDYGDPSCIENFKYPDVAQGLALSFNAVFFAIVFFTLGAYMKARLQQGNLRN